jgi:small subunit ribosomal protein S20
VANHKSSEKRILVTIKKNTANTAKRSETRTAVKKAVVAIKSGDAAATAAAVRGAESKLMKAAGRTISKKAASRKVSRLVCAAKKV